MWSQDPRGTLKREGTPDCIDRELDVQPASAYDFGVQNEIMFLRACVQYRPFFPTATLGTAIVSSYGECALVSTTLFVAEPT